MNRRLFFCVFLLGLHSYAIAQADSYTDSLISYVDTATLNTAHVQNLLNIGYRYTYSTPDKAEPYLIKADSIAQLLGENDRMNAVIQSYFGILYHQLTRYEEALLHTDKAIDLFEKLVLHSIRLSASSIRVRSMVL